MSDLVKVEIALLVGNGSEWQWMGKLSPASLKALCEMADKLSDADTDVEQ